MEVYQQLKANESTGMCRNRRHCQGAKHRQSPGLHIAKVDDYISKPFSPKDLVDSLEKVLAGREKSE